MREWEACPAKTGQDPLVLVNIFPIYGGFEVVLNWWPMANIREWEACLAKTGQGPLMMMVYYCLSKRTPLLNTHTFTPVDSELNTLSAA
jgi:hypothetical protein